MTPRIRWIYIDFIRTLAIYLVLLVHVSEWPESTPFVNWGLFPTLTLSRLGVPLFVMVSGAMLIPKQENWPQFITRRLPRLLKPWIFWAVVITFFEMSVTHSQSGSFLGLLRFNFVKIWFVPMLFGLYLITPAVRLFVRSAKSLDLWWVIGIWYITVSFWPFLRNTAAFPLISDNGLVRQVIQFSGYFLLGYAVIKTGYLPRITSWVLIISGIILTFIKVGHNLMFFDYISPGIVLLTTGVFMLIQRSGNFWQKLSGNRIGLSLTGVGKTTLGIYFLHPLVMHFLVLNKPGNGLLNSFILLLVTYPVVWLLQKVPGLKGWVT